jgi:DnaK suppressor protein
VPQDENTVAEFTPLPPDGRTRGIPSQAAPDFRRCGSVNAATARKRLESMLAELDRSIEVLGGDPQSAWDRSGADGGSTLTDTDRNRAMLDVATRQRRSVLAALNRMDDGNYGLCTDCGKPVPEGRLEARPEAARCVQCQSKRERRR